MSYTIVEAVLKDIFTELTKDMIAIVDRYNKITDKTEKIIFDASISIQAECRYSYDEDIELDEIIRYIIKKLLTTELAIDECIADAYKVVLNDRKKFLS